MGKAPPQAAGRHVTHPGRLAEIGNRNRLILPLIALRREPNRMSSRPLSRDASALQTRPTATLISSPASCRSWAWSQGSSPGLRRGVCCGAPQPSRLLLRRACFRRECAGRRLSRFRALMNPWIPPGAKEGTRSAVCRSRSQTSYLPAWRKNPRRRRDCAPRQAGLASGDPPQPPCAELSLTGSPCKTG